MNCDEVMTGLYLGKVLVSTDGMWEMKLSEGLEDRRLLIRHTAMRTKGYHVVKNDLDWAIVFNNEWKIEDGSILKLTYDDRD